MLTSVIDSVQSQRLELDWTADQKGSDAIYR